MSAHELIFSRESNIMRNGI